MPPIRSRPLREADVWLDETLWGDEPAPRRRRADHDDPLESLDSGTAPGFFDHEREPEGRDERTPEVHGERPPHGYGERDEIVARRTPPADPEVDLAPTGPVPGLLRRPLVEVQRAVNPPERRRTPAGPDRIAMWAVALALVTLVSAIVTAHG